MNNPPTRVFGKGRSNVNRATAVPVRLELPDNNPFSDDSAPTTSIFNEFIGTKLPVSLGNTFTAIPAAKESLNSSLQRKPIGSTGNPSKRATDLRTIVKNGHVTDIEILLTAIKKYCNVSINVFKVTVFMPSNYKKDELERYKIWVQDLGFQSKVTQSNVLYYECDFGSCEKVNKFLSYLEEALMNKTPINNENIVNSGSYYRDSRLISNDSPFEPHSSSSNSNSASDSPIDNYRKVNESPSMLSIANDISRVSLANPRSATKPVARSNILRDFSLNPSEGVAMMERSNIFHSTSKSDDHFSETHTEPDDFNETDEFNDLDNAGIIFDPDSQDDIVSHHSPLSSSFCPSSRFDLPPVYRGTDDVITRDRRSISCPSQTTFRNTTSATPLDVKQKRSFSQTENMVFSTPIIQTVTIRSGHEDYDWLGTAPAVETVLCYCKKNLEIHKLQAATGLHRSLTTGSWDTSTTSQQRSSGSVDSFGLGTLDCTPQRNSGRLSALLSDELSNLIQKNDQSHSSIISPFVNDSDPRGTNKKRLMKSVQKNLRRRMSQHFKLNESSMIESEVSVDGNTPHKHLIFQFGSPSGSILSSSRISIDTSVEHDVNVQLNMSAVSHASQVTMDQVNTSMDRSMDADSSDPPPMLDIDSIMDDMYINEEGPNITVLGGNYTGMSKLGKPVVKGDKDCMTAIEVFLFCESEELMIRNADGKDISFLPTWRWMDAHPHGYIILESSLSLSNKITGYFTTCPPNAWSVFYRTHTNPTVAHAVIHKHFVSTGRSSSLGSLSFHTANGGNDNSLILSPQKKTTHVNWNNFHIISCLIEYLLDPMEYAPSSKKSSRSYETTTTAAAAAKAKKEKENKRFSNLNYFMVSKVWTLACCQYRYHCMTLYNNLPKYSNDQWSRFVQQYQTNARYLNAGACKQVYLVASPTHQSYAFSVINMNDMISMEMDRAILDEISICKMCSLLTELHLSPFFVQVKEVFQYWKTIDKSKLNSMFRIFTTLEPTNATKKITYQYMLTEFCSGGDLEDYLIKNNVNDAIEIQSLRLILFQIFFCIFTGRKEFSLRHYDIKLLNFLITTATAESLGNGHKRMITFNDIKSYIGFGNDIFCLPMRTDIPELIKLTDYGTSCIGLQTMNDPINVQHYTTLENTPIEYLLLGSEAKQNFLGDTFCIGLSMFHLMTGSHPYEELLEDVLCPNYLIQKLSKHWSTKKMSNKYHVIALVIDSLDEGNGDSDLPTSSAAAVPGIVLYHTLYRYLILFSCFYDMNDLSIVYGNSPVFQVVFESLIHHPPKGGRSEERRKCYETFQRDKSQWSLVNGKHPIAVNCRRKLELLCPHHGMEILSKLLHFDPAKRCTLHEALLSPIFQSLKSSSSYTQLKKKYDGALFMHYYRPNESDDSLGLY